MSQAIIKTGDYIIRYFNRYGARLKDLQDVAESQTAALAAAEARIQANRDFNGEHYLPASFAIDRRIFNSLDKGA